jgi:RNA polymerase sigma-70 factor (ECF subfamily)
VNAELPFHPVISQMVEQDRWLAAFHAGDRTVLEKCYRDTHASVLSAARRLLTDCDAETVVHEVYYRLISDGRFRQSFKGGSVAAWLAQVTTNSAIDHLRRRRREAAPLPPESELESRGADARVDDELEAKILVERFRRERLPPEWAPVFDTRFLRRLPQREAAHELGIPRSTLVYQEQRIRELLTKFLIRPAPRPSVSGVSPDRKESS